MMRAKLFKTPLLVAVEGNIGAGKSNLVAQLERESSHWPATRVFSEPVSTNPYLADFYREPKEFALRIQLWLLGQRTRTYQRAIEHCQRWEGKPGLVLLDRSVWSDAVFARQAYKDKLMSDSEYAFYAHLRSHLDVLLPLSCVTLALDVPVDVCLHRVLHVRRRAVEQNMPRAYLAGLEEEHETHYQQLAQAGAPVLRMDWTHYGSAKVVLAELLRLQTGLEGIRDEC